ncbi:MAG TPA: hypothetical protein VGK51_09385 [Actinomycetota bacterium]
MVEIDEGLLGKLLPAAGDRDVGGGRALGQVHPVVLAESAEHDVHLLLIVQIAGRRDDNLRTGRRLRMQACAEGKRRRQASSQKSHPRHR